MSKPDFLCPRQLTRRQYVDQLQWRRDSLQQMASEHIGIWYGQPESRIWPCANLPSIGFPITLTAWYALSLPRRLLAP